MADGATTDPTVRGSAARMRGARSWRMAALVRIRRHEVVPSGLCRGLFLDLPVGVHPGGFDTWRWPELFAAGMSTGAPPDDFFARGQDWTVPPPPSWAGPRAGPLVLCPCLDHHMHHASWLRIDHVMALHRLFWVPEGAAPVMESTLSTRRMSCTQCCVWSHSDTRRWSRVRTSAPFLLGFGRP